MARAFVNDPTPSQQKREKLVDSLLGSRDYVAQWSNRWADLLPSARAVRVPEAAHMGLYEQPEVFAREVCDFLG